jgi:Tfp pilus assembly protein PilN
MINFVNKKAVLNFFSKKRNFLFLESGGAFFVYKIDNKKIDLILSADFSEIDEKLVWLKKEYPFISSTDNVWVTNHAKIEHIERASMNKDELFKYVKWKLPDLVDLPIQDLVYDLLNYGKGFSEGKNVTTVVIGNKHVTELQKVFAKNKIKLSAIDSNKTVVLDLLMDLWEKKTKKSILLLRVLSGGMEIDLYDKEDLVFSRKIDFGSFDLENESYQNVLNKVMVEIQRSEDFFSRQLGGDLIENVLFFFDKSCYLGKEIIGKYNQIKTDLINNFRFNELIVDKYFDFDEKIVDLDFISACFLRGKNSTNQINLMRNKKIESQIVSDFKRLMAFVFVVEFLMALLGATYEWRSNVTSMEVERLKALNVTIQDSIDKIKQKPVADLSLKEKVQNLVKTKQRIIELQKEMLDPHVVFSDFMSEIAYVASKDEIYINKILFSTGSIEIDGVFLDKELFSSFLEELQKFKSLKNKEVNFIGIREEGVANPKDGKLLSFKISTSMETVK